MKRQLIVTIVADFGSDFQQETQGNSLLIMLQAWKKFMESKHKSNEATITEEESEKK